MMVFLDMDEVLVNFIGGAFKAHGRKWSEEEGSVYDFWKKWPMSNNEFWKGISSMDYWANLEPLPHAKKLYDLCKEKAEKVFFCSTPCLSENSATGKLLWLSHFLGRQVHANEYFLCSEKQMLAGPGRMLIDDSEMNCDKWRRAGGESFCWPAPWNRTSTTPEETLKLLERVLTYE